MIQILDKETINHIAAGEVVERPSAVVKELIENAVDAHATAITVEIKEGGISFIRVTDNGSGIARSDIKTAFLRHATSKIKTKEDLLSITSLGFRGEALSSIAAVSQVELITKEADEITGSRYEIHGGSEVMLEEIGCPSGTTMIVRNLFYNTPARRKFLKSKTTEGNYIQELVLKYSLCKTDIRFTFIVDGRTRLQTNGDHQLKTNIYYNFGADTTKNLFEISAQKDDMTLYGFIGKPELARGNRNYMNYYVNGRYIKSPIITKAIEDAYKSYLMQHRYPFVVLMLTIDSHRIDVNVHPTKMEIRFSNQPEVYDFFYETVSEGMKQMTLIPEVSLEQDTPVSEKTKKVSYIKEETGRTEPFEAVFQKSNYSAGQRAVENEEASVFTQMNLWKEEAVQNALPAFRIIGQVFDTYWLLEYKDELLIVDQHAAHEKVLYEKLRKRMAEKKSLTQSLVSPIVINLSGREKEVLELHKDVFAEIGFVLEPFGDRDYLIAGIPADFFNVPSKELFLELLDSLLEKKKSAIDTEFIMHHCATMSCKAAVKGNQMLSYEEAKKLFEEMLQMEEPYHCPHGRPTTIAMNRYDFEKKFKRVL